MPRSVTGHDVTKTLYESDSSLYESDSSLMVRTAPVEGQPPVILKILKKAFPSPRELERFRQEYGVTRSLDSRGIIKVYGLETHENTLMLLVEDFGGESLSQWLQQRTFDLETFLSLAVRITESLGDIHSSQIIHKDINPSNIVWNAATDELKIIDFGVSTHLSRTHSLSGQPDALDGTLAYMSPEQTGRMNASVDHRADFYSLGVTFYELLTGQLPFSTDDSNELVHCHIAREPAPAHLIEPAVPVAVSNIVEKLMAKKAEGRYQHTGGILADLEHALSQLRTTRQIAEFTLGEQDCCGQLHVSRTLYGRDDEVRILHDGYDRVAAGGTSEMVLVAGYSGVGKTSLIREIQRPIVQGQGLFAAGKFDQFQREIPYSAIVEAFQGLICELLAAPAEQVNEWRRLLLSKLHGNGQLIVDVVPDVEFLIGPQPTVPTLGPTEAFNRFNRVFQEFISAFSQPSCPLTLVLDDLQWADAASLQLLRMLMGKSGVRDLLLLGAYRDNEIDPAHPLLPAVEAIEAEGTRVQTLTLQPLAERHVTQLLSDTLNAPLKHVEPLCRLLLARTEGNPFFLNQFLTALYQAELLVFDREHMAWTWKNEEIEKSKISENVVELMIWQVADLPADTQEALRIGSCIGNRFDLRTLSIVLEQSFEQTCQTIRPAVDSGLLLSAESLDETGQQSGVLSADASIQNAPVASFRFLHDRVQQAAYSLTSDESQPQTHLTIGRLLLANMNAEQLEDSLFEVVNHLNQGRELIDSDAERRQVAELNLRATRKSRLSSAYSPALKYICSGIDFLSHDCWESEYSFALSYWLEKGEVEYLNADWNDSLATLNEALERTTDLLDRCAINERKSTLYRMKNDLRKSLDVALDALAELGIELEAFPDDAATVGDLTRAREMIEGVQWDALDSLPELRDPAKLAAMALLRECFAPAYFLGSSLISMIGTRMTEITFTHGNSPHSATGYIFFASITLSTGLKDFDAAYRVGQLALTVNGGTRADRANEALILDMWGTFVCHYKEPIDNARDCMIRGYRSGVENGAYQWAGYCAAINLFMSFWGPDTLGAVSKQIDDVIPGLQKIDPNMAQYYRAISATIHNVTVETDNHCQLSAEKWPDVQEIYDRGREQNDVFTLLVVTTCQLALANWFDERTRAAEFAEIGEEFATGDTGVFLTPVFRFHQCLAYCGVCETVDEQKRQQYIDRIEATIRSFEQMAEHCPSTYLHQANLCKAELARIRGNAAEAMNLYDEAISAAKDSGFLQNEALANELAARFWVALGKENISKIYFKEAAYRYWLWGAQPKAQLLRVEYEDSYQTAQFTEALPLRPAGNQPNGSTDEQPVTPSGLDLDSIGKGVRTISGEISIDCLPDKIIRTMVECAGAESGFLVLENSGDLQMAAACGPAEFDADGQNLNAAPGKRGAGSVIEFVARTGRRLLLDDATKNEPFSADPDLKRRQVLSVLCFPLSLHDNQRAYVYLENTLASHAFDADSMGVVEVLAAQASASLSNAKGYEALRKSEETLRVREEQFRLFSQSTGDCFWNWDMVAGTVDRSIGFERAFGYSKADIHSRVEWSRERMHPEDRERVLSLFAAAVAEGRSQWDYEYRFRCGDGSYAVVHDHVCLIRDDSGKVIRSLGAMHDITERKKAEKDLRLSEERFRELAENIREVFWITSADYEQMIYVSPAFEQIWGRSCDSLYQDPKSWVAAIHPEDRQVVHEALLRDVDAGVFDHEYRIVRPDGSVRWIRDRAFAVRDVDGVLLRISGLAQDITAQKVFARALKKSNDELDLRVRERTTELASTNQELIEEIKQRKYAQSREDELARIMDESLNEIYVFHAETMRFMHVNQGAQRNLGYSMEELRELTPLELKPVLSSEKFDQLVCPLRDEEGATICFETVHQRKNGTEYPVEVNLQLTTFEHSPCFVAIILDITDRKMAEQEQLLSAEIMENMAEGVSLTRVSDSTLVYTNSRFDRIFGYGRGELLGIHTSALYAAGERTPRETAEAVAEALTQSGSWSGELHTARKNGSTFWMQATISSFQHPVFGDVRIGVGQDISERRKIQQALIRSEERNLAAQRIAKFGHWDWNIASGELYWSDEIYRIFGLEPQEFGATYEAFLETVHPDDRATVRAFTDEALNGDEPYSLDHRIVTPAGKLRFVHEEASVSRDTAGTPIRMVGTVQDITARKQSEQALLESETRFRALLESAPDAMVVIDSDSAIVLINAQAEKLFGFTREELLGQSIDVLVPHRFRDVHRGYQQEFIESPQARPMGETRALWGVRRDGSEFPVEISLSPIIVESGVLIASAIRDVTQRKAAEEDLRRFEQIVAISSDMVSLVDENFVYLAANKAYLSAFKLTSEELIGRTVAAVVGDERFESVIRPAAERCLAGENVSYHGWFEFAGSGRLCLDVEYTPYLSNTNDVTGFLVNARDVTKRRNAEETARKHRDELAHVSRISTMGQMATGIAHELNQPLTGIATYSYAAKALAENIETGPRELKEILGKLEGQAVRAGDIVRRLRGFLKKNRSAQVLTDLNSLIRDVAMIVDPDIRESKGRLELRIDEPSAVLKVDEIQIQQVLVNLVRNAIDAMRDTPVDRREITMMAQVLQDGQCEVTVRDAGSGLAPEELEQVFDAFFSTKQEGMGMGLPISRSIVEAHGGKLWARSNKGPGVTFGFTIPQLDVCEA